MVDVSTRSRKNKLRFAAIALFAFSLLLSGCQPAAEVKAPTQSSSAETPQLDAEIVAAHNRFGYLLFADLVRETMSEEAGNVVVSPLSIALALAMAENGASGETALAIAQAMQRTGAQGSTPASDDTKAPELSNIDDLAERLNQANLALIDSLMQAQASGDIRLNVANALWHRLGLTLSPEFGDVVKRYYDAEIAALDFAAGESVDRINAWANEATEGLILKIVDELSDDLAVLIANAVYFQGNWQTPFDSHLTRPLPFHLPSGESPEVDMMYRSGSIEYFEGDFQAIRLPYGETGRTAMYIFLPPEDESIEAFAGRFEEVANEAFDNFRAYEGEVWLPRLDVAYKASLNEPLKRLGMDIAFNPTAADFSRMIPDARPGDFFIGDVLHQAALKMDETGTEAAAVTSVEIRLTSVPVWRFSFKADRPFLLAIRDDETGAILFAGGIVDPRA